MSTNGNAPQGGNGESLRVRAGGDVAREEFGARQLLRTGETASTALATQARAAVEARFVMAMQRPRNIDNFRVNILAACKRPLFAEDALYSKPVGRAKNDETGEWEEKFVEGLSIRFAEEAVRLFGNAMTENVTIYDDAQKRIIRLSATDLETNVVHYKDITVEKTVERRFLKKGQQALGSRLNSYGETTHLVEATEDDLAKKEGALGSKALRDKMLMLVPADIKEEAKALIKVTQEKKDAEDPEAAKRKVLDSFAGIGIMPNQIAEFLGHDTANVQPAEMQKLRAIFSAIKDGEATWADVIEQKRDFEKELADKKAKEAGEKGAAAAQPEGKRISLKKGEATAQAPGAPTKVSAPQPGPTQVASGGEPRSMTIVKDGKDGAAAAAALSGDAAPEDKGDAPSPEELASGKPAPRGTASLLADDDDLPPWGGGGGRK